MNDQKPLVATTFTPSTTESKVTRFYALCAEDIDEIVHAQQIYTRMITSVSGIDSLPLIEQDRIANQSAALSLRYAYWFRKQQEESFAARYAKADE
jgi:hypothetical protein